MYNYYNNRWIILKRLFKKKISFYDGKIKNILDAISGTITNTESALGNGIEIINNKSYKVQYNE